MPDSSIESQGTYPMLRIETELDGPQMVLRLIGRIRDDSLEELRQRVQGRTTLIVLDLAEVTWSISRQFAFCAIAKTRKSNYGIAPHTFWSGFAASALKVKSNGRIAENSAIAESLESCTPT
jgi:hypothetical protein